MIRVVLVVTAAGKRSRRRSARKSFVEGPARGVVADRVVLLVF
jgi:hypothetical protein